MLNLIKWGERGSDEEETYRIESFTVRVGGSTGSVFTLTNN